MTAVTGRTKWRRPAIIGQKSKSRYEICIVSPAMATPSFYVREIRFRTGFIALVQNAAALPAAETLMIGAPPARLAM